MDEKTTPLAISCAVAQTSDVVEPAQRPIPTDAVRCRRRPLQRSCSGAGTPVLTVIVPVYNEVSTAVELLHRVLAAPYAKQVIVVDDGSTDGTAEVLLAWPDCSAVELVRHETNRGKGAAIRTALQHARAVYHHSGWRSGIRSAGLSAAGAAAFVGRGAGGLRIEILSQSRGRPPRGGATSAVLDAVPFGRRRDQPGRAASLWSTAYRRGDLLQGISDGSAAEHGPGVRAV